MNQTAINRADVRTRFIFDDMPVRGLHVRLENVWQHIVKQKNYPAAIRRALGELLAAGVLLSGNLKNEGTLIVQVQGRGRLKMLVAEAASDRTVRATARWDETAEIADDESLGDLLGEGGGIAQMLANYMKRSEQIDTHIVLSASDEAAGGLLVQRLPEAVLDEEAWEHVSTLARTLTADELAELDAQHVLYRLFHETPPRVFEPETFEFSCTCSRGKVSDMLLMLGGEEVGGVVVEQGSIEVDCDFCHSKYVFDETDVNALFGEDVVGVAKGLPRHTVQ